MKFTIDFPKVRINPNALPKQTIVEFCRKECLNTLARLRQAVGSGKGADGQSIKPGGYSKSYQEAIAKGQVRGGTGGRGVMKTSTTPNLTITGDLLGSEQVRATPDGAEIFLNGSHYSGLANSALMAVHISNGFEGVFEFGDPDIKRVEQAADKLLEEVANKLIDTK